MKRNTPLTPNDAIRFFDGDPDQDTDCHDSQWAYLVVIVPFLLVIAAIAMAMSMPDGK